MRREITTWYSERLLQDMPLITWGHAGAPVLMLPTAAADFLEYERFLMINVVRRWIEAGKARMYSVNSVNRRSLMNQHTPPRAKIELIKRYDGYLTDEVLPLIRQDCGDAGARPLVMGISLGAYLAANVYLRHPDLFGGALLYSGTYDIRSYLGGHYDDDVYFNNPSDYIENLGEGHALSAMRQGRIVLFTGQGAYEAPERTRRLSEALNRKNVPHWLDVWGHDVNHDWPWWRKAIQHHFGALFGPA